MRPYSFIPNYLQVSGRELVSAIRDSGEGYRLIQTTAAASSGSSGGGMFNEFGELIGIVASKIMEGENITFAVPVNYVRGMISSESTMTLADLARRFPGDGSQAPSGIGETNRDISSDEASVALLDSLISRAQLDYREVQDGYWATQYAGDTGDDINVVIGTHEDLVLVQSFPDTPSTLTRQQMSKLLALNYSSNLAKVSLDETNELVVLQEVELRLLDGQELDLIVAAVAWLTNEVAVLLQEASLYEVRQDLSSQLNTPGLTSLALLGDGVKLSYSSSDWQKDDEDSGTPGEYFFNHTSGLMYIKVIAERAEFPIEKMPELALMNAREVDPEAKEILRGERLVNGRRFLFLEYQAAPEGVPFTLYTHFYSDSSGTVQIMGYTTPNLFDESRSTIEKFVSGLHVDQGEVVSEVAPTSYNEASAISSVRNVVVSQITYSATTGSGSYAPNLKALLDEDLVDAELGSGTKDGYAFSSVGSQYIFTVNATPLAYGSTGSISFFADESGVIRFTREDRPATISDPPL